MSVSPIFPLVSSVYNFNNNDSETEKGGIKSKQGMLTDDHEVTKAMWGKRPKACWNVSTCACKTLWHVARKALWPVSTFLARRARKLGDSNILSILCFGIQLTVLIETSSLWLKNFRHFFVKYFPLITFLYFRRKRT